MIEHAKESGESRVDLWLLPSVTIFSFASSFTPGSLSGWRDHTEELT